MFTVVLYVLMRPFSTFALIEITSAPEIPRSVFAASWTATSAAFAKLSGDDPMIVTTLATSAIAAPFLARSNRPGRTREAPSLDTHAAGLTLLTGRTNCAGHSTRANDNSAGRTRRALIAA